MALSELKPPTAPWSPNPLLNGKSQSFSFLRTQWDETKVRSFGPWRVAERTEPTDALTLAEPLPSAKLPVDGPEPSLEPITVSPQTLEAENTLVSESALTALRAAAYQQGLTDGQAQMREKLGAELDAERAKERELIRHLGIELRSISQDPQRFFEPLKRLSLHVAEQLVRAELQLSGQAVNGLIQGCIQQLDHQAQPVQVSLNPQDLQRVKSLGQAATEHLQLESDALLRPGSVRVRVQDTVVQDKVDALPENTPKRDWDRQVIDVQDTDIKNAQPDEDSPA